MVAAAVLAGACAGPEAPFSVRVRELPSDVTLGGGKAPRQSPPAAAVPPLALPLTVPGLTGFAVSVSDIAAPVTPPPAAPVPACPKADPRDPPKREAVNTVALPPAPGAYPFRDEGSFTLTGANAKSGAFPPAGTRVVDNVVDLTTGEQKAYGFDVVTTLGSLTTTVGYALYTEHSSPTATRAGLYLSRMESRTADGETFEFAPRPGGLLLLPFPVVPGERFSAAGADPVNQTALSYTGTVGQKTRVDACGTLLDAFEVVLDGTIGAEQPPGPPVEQPGPAVGASPAGRDEFRAVYAFGTQYGALSLRDQVALRRESADGALSQTNLSTLNVEPAPPRRPGAPS